MKKSFSSSQLIKKLQQIGTLFKDFSETLKDLSNAGFCGSGSKRKSFDVAASKIVGLQHAFQILQLVNSQQVSRYNQQIQRVRSDIVKMISEYPSIPSSNKQNIQTVNIQKKIDRVEYKVPDSKAPLRQQLFLALSLQPNPKKVLQLLPQVQNSQWIYGRLHEQGNIFDANPQTARKYYQKAINKNQAQGYYRLGCLIQKDLANSRDLEEYEYIELWEKAAEMGHLQAIVDLGFLYEKGIEGFTKPDLPKAHQYYLKAVKDKFPRAMNNLASFYLTNPTFRQEHQPIQLLKSAASMGYCKAFLNLAICYQKGKLVPVDKDKAISLFRKGAERNDDQCKLFWVYNLIHNNSPSEEDWALAHQYCLQVISNNSAQPEGYYFLGYMYEIGLGCFKEEQTSFLYYLKAAGLGYAAAINKVADFYHSGFGVQKNRALAFQYYKSAAELNYPDALINLAYIFEQGYQGVASRNPDKAIQLYEKASDLGSSQAMIILGEMYVTGKFVRKNQNKAKEYFKSAAKLGSKVAQDFLKENL